jgi:thiol-disulfide isomerase/thioredoxin
LRANDLREALTQAGSQVFIHYLAETIDGFHARPESHLSKADLKARKALPAYLSGAIKQLTHSTAAVQERVRSEMTIAKVKHSDTRPGLRAISSKTEFQFTLPNLNGKAVQLKDFRGKPVIVSFWASWCPPCVRELPSMNTLAHDPRYGKIPIVMVNIGESPEQIRNFLRQHKVKASILLDRDKAVYKKWNIYVVPSNFVFNANGELVLGSVGAIDWTEEAVKRQLDSVLTDNRMSKQ